MPQVLSFLEATSRLHETFTSELAISSFGLVLPHPSIQSIKHAISFCSVGVVGLADKIKHDLISMHFFVFVFVILSCLLACLLFASLATAKLSFEHDFQMYDCYDQAPPRPCIAPERTIANDAMLGVHDQSHMDDALPSHAALYQNPRVLNPRPGVVLFQDPRSKGRREAGVIGFAARRASPQETGCLNGPDACDSFCGSAFLGMNYDVSVPFVVRSSAGVQGPFSRAEHAFDHVGGRGDWQFSGAVLRAKFSHGSPCAVALCLTSDAFLLERGGDQALEQVWAGCGTNRLGLQLMIIRDELAQSLGMPMPGVPGNSPMTWTDWARDVCKVDLHSGRQDSSGVNIWQSAVKAATSKILLMLLAECGSQGAGGSSVSGSAHARPLEGEDSHP